MVISEPSIKKGVRSIFCFVLERCQLTGAGKFTDKIEKRMGRRIENRGLVRPRKGG